MTDELKKFMAQIGVSSETIDKLTTAPEDGADPVDVTSLVSTYNSTKTDLLKNDPDFINGLKKEIRGKELSTAENKVKRVFGLTTEEMEGKNYEEILEAGRVKIQASSGSGTEELQAKLLEANTTIKELKEVQLPAAEQQATAKINDFHKLNKIQAMINSHPLLIDGTALTPGVLATLQQKYDITVDENQNLITKTKDGLAPLSADGTKKVTLEEIIKTELTGMKAIKESNAGGDPSPGTPPGTPPAGDPGKPKYNLPHLQKAQANAETMKDIRKV